MRFFDVSRFPLVVATAPSGRDAAADIPVFYREWDEVFARGPHVILIDLSQVDAVWVGAKERKRVAEEASRRRASIVKDLRAEARLCPGRAVRALMTAFDWLAERPYRHPIEHFADRAAAEAWLLQHAASLR